MKSIVSIAVAALCMTGAAQAADLIVKVDGIRVPKGRIMAAVSNSEAAWNNQAKPVAAQAEQAMGSEVTLRFPDLAPGSYAVQVMHDENGDGKLDTNFVGLPIEGYGFSNNPNIMRRANYDEVRFELSEPSANIVIHLH